MHSPGVFCSFPRDLLILFLMIGLVEIKEACLGFVINSQMFLTQMYVLAILSVFVSVGRKQGPVRSIFYLKWRIHLKCTEMKWGRSSHCKFKSKLNKKFESLAEDNRYVYIHLAENGGKRLEDSKLCGKGITSCCPNWLDLVLQEKFLPM